MGDVLGVRVGKASEDLDQDAAEFGGVEVGAAMERREVAARAQLHHLLKTWCAERIVHQEGARVGRCIENGQICRTV